MTKWEQKLVFAIRQIIATYGVQKTLDDKFFRAVLKDLNPDLSRQREYKMLDILIKCGGNQILADALKQPAELAEAKKRTLIRRMEDDFVMDASAAERICALYLSAISGDDSYINRLDGQKPVETPPAQPSPAPQAVPKTAPAPKPAAQNQSAPAQKQTPQVASSAKWTAIERALIDAIRRITNDGSTYPPKEDFLRQVVHLVPGIEQQREYGMLACFLEDNTSNVGQSLLGVLSGHWVFYIYAWMIPYWMTGKAPYHLAKEESNRICELYLAATHQDDDFLAKRRAQFVAENASKPSALSAPWSATERALIDAIRKITKDGSVYPPKEDFLRQVVQLVPGIEQQREYGVLDYFLTRNTLSDGSSYLEAFPSELAKKTVISLSNGGSVLEDLLNQPNGFQFAVAEVLSNLMLMIGKDPYHLSREESERMCELYLAAIYHDDDFFAKCRAAFVAENRSQSSIPAAQKPASQADSRSYAHGHAYDPNRFSSQPQTAPAQKQTPPAQQPQSAPTADSKKKPIARRIGMVILSIAALCIVASMLFGNSHSASPAGNEEMAEAWLAVQDRILQDIEDCALDYVHPDSIEQVGQALDEIDGVFFTSESGNISDSFTFSGTSSAETLLDSDIKKLAVGGKATAELSFHEMSKKSQEDSYERLYYLSFNRNGQKSDRVHSLILPAFVCEVDGADKASVMQLLGITEEMLTWLISERNMSYIRDYPSGEHFNLTLYKQDDGSYELSLYQPWENGEQEGALRVYIVFSDTKAGSVEIYSDFYRFPEPDYDPWVIPFNSALAKQYGEDFTLPTETDRVMAASWVRARDAAIDKLSQSEFDFLSCTSLEELGAYCDEVGDLYFLDEGSTPTNTFTDKAINEYGSLHVYPDSDSAALHKGLFSAYCDSGDDIDTHYPSKYLSISIDGDAVGQTQLDIFPPLVGKLLGSDRDSALYTLGITQQMLDWCDQLDDDTQKLILFGRSDPRVSFVSDHLNSLRLSRYIEAPDGDTVKAEIELSFGDSDVVDDIDLYFTHFER